MRISHFLPLLTLAHTAYSMSSNTTATIDSSRFATTAEIKHLVDQVRKDGLRLPGSAKHRKVVDWLACQLSGIPGLNITRQNFTIDGWEPTAETLYDAAKFKIGGEDVDIIGAILFSRPTNGSFISAPLLYVPQSVNLASASLHGKIIVRDYNLLPIPESIIASTAYFASANVVGNSTYTRPFIGAPDGDMIVASALGAAGYISMFNISRSQMESYYDGHSGVHWPIPGIYIGAEQYQQVRQAAAANMTASIRIDATASPVEVPEVFATLPGMTNETIVVNSHTDGVTYVQENGPAALLTLARYFASLPIEERRQTLKFAFTSSHLAFQRDSGKTLAKAIDATFETNDIAMVIAIEHLGTRELLPAPATDGSYGNVLNYTGNGEFLLWAVEPVESAIAGVIQATKGRNLDNTIIAPGFPPTNDQKVPTYTSFGGIGTYFHTALIPTMALISGPWSLWAPSFGADALDYERLRLQHMAIGDVILGLGGYGKEELMGNYTEYRKQRAEGVETSDINEVSSQYLINGYVDLGS